MAREFGEHSAYGKIGVMRTNMITLIIDVTLVIINTTQTTLNTTWTTLNNIHNTHITQYTQ